MCTSAVNCAELQVQHPRNSIFLLFFFSLDALLYFPYRPLGPVRRSALPTADGRCDNSARRRPSTARSTVAAAAAARQRPRRRSFYPHRFLFYFFFYYTHLYRTVSRRLRYGRRRVCVRPPRVPPHPGPPRTYLFVVVSPCVCICRRVLFSLSRKTTNNRNNAYGAAAR